MPSVADLVCLTGLCGCVWLSDYAYVMFSGCGYVMFFGRAGGSTGVRSTHINVALFRFCEGLFEFFFFFTFFSPFRFLQRYTHW